MNTYIFKVAVFTKQAKSEYNSRILFLVPRIPHLGLQLGLSPIFVLAVKRSTGHTHTSLAVNTRF